MSSTHLSTSQQAWQANLARKARILINCAKEIRCQVARLRSQRTHCRNSHRAHSRMCINKILLLHLIYQGPLHLGAEVIVALALATTPHAPSH